MEQLVVHGARRQLETDTPDEHLRYLLEYLTESIMREDPELIGFSIMYPRQIYIALALAANIRSRIGTMVRIVFGGAALSIIDLAALLVASEDLIDGIVAGEGEKAVEWLCEGKSVENCPGILLPAREGSNRPQPASRTTDYPVTDYGDFELGRYLGPKVVLPTLFSRGCSWRRCRFCTHNVSWGAYRRLEHGTFAAHLSVLSARTGTEMFYFADQYIGPQDLEDISQVIIDKNIRANFHVMARPEPGYTREMLELLYKAGCRWISWGIESWSQPLLDTCRKGTRAEDMIRMLSDAHEVGISNLAMLIFGLPGSTDRDLYQTMEFFDRTESFVDAFTSSNFQLFDNTPFGRNSRKYGLYPLENEILLRRNEVRVHSTRRGFSRHSEISELSDRGAWEIAQWNRHRSWIREPSFFETLGTEHYLLHATARYAKPKPEGRPQPRPRAA